MRLELNGERRQPKADVAHLDRLSQGKTTLWDRIREADRLASIATTHEEQLQAFKTPDDTLSENLQRSALAKLDALKNSPKR